MGSNGVNISEPSLRKSYSALDKLRKSKDLSWADMRNKLDQFKHDLQAGDSGTRRLRAARIPLTERDWERIGS